MSSQSVLESVNCEYNVEIKDNITIVKISETHVDAPPTEEQKENLLKFDKEFANRYTNEDEDYVDIIKLGCTIPPLVSSYYPLRHYRRDNRSRAEKREMENDGSSSNNKYSPYPLNKRVNYGYNNDYRR